MGAIYLSEADVMALVDMPMAIAAVEEAFRHLAAGDAENVPRVRARAPGVILHSMIAAAGYLGYVGWKCYTTTRAAARFHVGLYEQSTGSLVALVEADHLGHLRTGATTGVALRLMASPEAKELGLFGSGRQAETQLAAAAAVLPLRQAFVYSRSEQRRAARSLNECASYWRWKSRRWIDRKKPPRIYRSSSRPRPALRPSSMALGWPRGRSCARWGRTRASARKSTPQPCAARRL